MPLGQGSAFIEDRPVNFFNAQSGITVVGGGMYNTLTIVFASAKGEGITITLVAPAKFEGKEYRVGPVDRPDAENAQMTFYSKENKLYEALGKIGTGSVRISRLTDNSIEGSFFGMFQLQGDPRQTLKIEKGEFHSMLTRPEPE